MWKPSLRLRTRRDVGVMLAMPLCFGGCAPDSGERGRDIVEHDSGVDTDIEACGSTLIRTIGTTTDYDAGEVARVSLSLELGGMVLPPRIAPATDAAFVAWTATFVNADGVAITVPAPSLPFWIGPDEKMQFSVGIVATAPHPTRGTFEAEIQGACGGLIVRLPYSYGQDG